MREFRFLSAVWDLRSSGALQWISQNSEYLKMQVNFCLYILALGFCDRASWANCEVLAPYKAAPHNRYQPHPAEPAQHTTCSNTRLGLLKMGITMSETCWESIDNKHLLHLFGFLSHFTFCLYIAVEWRRRLIAGLSPWRPGFDSRLVLVRWFVDRVAVGRIFIRVLRFSAVSFVTPTPLILHLHVALTRRRNRRSLGTSK